MVNKNTRCLLQGHVSLIGLCLLYFGLVPSITNAFWRKVAAVVQNKASEWAHIEAAWAVRVSLFQYPPRSFSVVQAEEDESKTQLVKRHFRDFRVSGFFLSFFFSFIITEKNETSKAPTKKNMEWDITVVNKNKWKKFICNKSPQLVLKPLPPTNSKWKTNKQTKQNKWSISFNV